MDNCVTIVQGNDFTLNITLSILNEETQVPEAYDLTDARLIEIKLISQISGHTLRLAPYKLTEKNVLSALVSGNKLKLTDYDVEVSFVKNGLNKRAYECNVIRVVRCNGDTDYTTQTDGESGYGIDISIKADVEQVYLGKNIEGKGTTDYNDLENKPSINDVTLEGNKTSEDLGLADKGDIPSKTSQLENDSDFATKAEVTKATKDLATKESVTEDLAKKVDKAEGKGLSTNDFTDEQRAKLDSIAEGATKVTVDTDLREDSENPVQNRVITQKLNELDDRMLHLVVKISVSDSTGMVTSHTWDEIRKFIQNETPIRVLFDGLDTATPLEVHYQDAEDGYYSGVISTADFRREFRIDHSLSVDITDTYYPETFIFETGSGTAGEDDSVTYKVTTDLDTIKACIAAAKARKGNQRIVVNTPDGRFCEFSIVYPRTDSLRAVVTTGDTGYALNLSSVEDEFTMTVVNGIIDLSDYYTKEETNTKLSGYALKDNVLIITDLLSGSDMRALISNIFNIIIGNPWRTQLSNAEIGDLGLFEKYSNIGIFNMDGLQIEYSYIGTTSSSMVVILRGNYVTSLGLRQILMEYVDSTHANIQLTWAVDKQSDWNTTSSSDASFIKNKPTKLSQFENDENFATKTEVDTKVSKEDGKGLSTNDFTNEDKLLVASVVDKLSKITQREIADSSVLSIECEYEGGVSYKGNNITNLTILAHKTDNTVNNGFETIVFSTGDSPSISLDGFSFANGDTPKFSANTLYEINILYNETLDTFLATYATYQKVDYSEDKYMYGVEFDTTVSSPDCTRIGNTKLHKILPVQSLMRGCLLDDDGNVVKYLNPKDWTSEVRDGSQGQVMVELPQFYWKFETDGAKRRVKLSLHPIDGYIKVPLRYVGAYEASLQRSTLKLSSVVNTTADYRGGNNNSANDGQSNSFLGRPATVTSRTNYRNYARNRKSGSTQWNAYTYGVHKELYWLFVVEYATLNSQAEFNAQLTSEGYRQGGLGAGVSTISGAKWSAFNGYYPFIPCGHSDSLGNRTGYVEYTMPDEYINANIASVVSNDTLDNTRFDDVLYHLKSIDNQTSVQDSSIAKVQVNRYRGVELPFGHIFKFADGINVRISPTEENGGDNRSKVFVCDDPAKFSDTGYDGYRYVGDEARTGGYGKEHIFGEEGDMIPSAVGGGSTTDMCDYHYTNIPATETLRAVLFCGDAVAGANAGFACASSTNAPSRTTAYIGSRLCFIPTF